MIDPLFNGKNIVPSGNVNYRPGERPEAQRADRQGQDSSPTRPQRAKAWGELDKEVTDQAYFVTWLWDNDIELHVEERQRRSEQVQLRCLGPHVQLTEVDGIDTTMTNRGPGVTRRGLCTPRLKSVDEPCVRYIIRRLLWVVVLLFLVSFTHLRHLLPAAVGRPGAAARRPPAEPRSWSSRSGTTSASTTRGTSSTATT